MTAKGRSVRTIGLVLSLGVAVLGGAAAAEDLKTSKPEKVGISSERLQRINEVMERHIKAGDITGAVTAIARRGKVVYFQAHGLADVDAKKPMTSDAIFRMASSSKPVVGVAALMLMEEGKIRLTDPVSRYIPEFKDTKVAVPKVGAAVPPARGAAPAARSAAPAPNPPVGANAPAQPGGARPAQAQANPDDFELVPANREITIKDLMTHTSGLLSGGAGQRYNANRVRREPGDTLETFIPKLGAVPLDFQPGTRWSYSPGTGIDVLGRIVEIASGKPLDVFLRERIFEPLGMVDTFFSLPEDRIPRLLPLYRRVGESWQKADADGRGRTPVKYFSGSGGLVSTAHDYLMFEQMLVNGGELNGKRLLGPRTVELMGTNQVGDLYRGFDGNQEGSGFGLTVFVVLDNAKAGIRRSNGAFGWGGAFGTMSWTDPREKLAGVLMLQQPHRGTQADFQNAVMQAIVE